MKLRRAAKPAIPDPGRDAIEPCRLCGEETAVGSVLYSDRREVDDGSGERSWVCRLCVERASSSGTRATEDELRRAITEAGMIGQAWGSQAH